MMLIARIGTSDETDERVLELAARVVELEQIELGRDDRAADLGAAVARRREREGPAAALLEGLEHLGDALDLLEDLLDLALRIVAAAADGHRDLANLALHVAELGLGADAEQLALAEHEQAIAGLTDLGQDVARDQDRVVLLEVV